MDGSVKCRFYQRASCSERPRWQGAHHAARCARPVGQPGIDMLAMYIDYVSLSIISLSSLPAVPPLFLFLAVSRGMWTDAVRDMCRLSSKPKMWSCGQGGRPVLSLT